MNILLGVCDHPSAASTERLCAELQALGSVKVVLTTGSKQYLPQQPDNAVDDAAEWYQWKKVGDEVLHIELTRWADCLLIAPLSANYMAKLAHGICDDLLTSVARAWPPEKPILLAPVISAAMWQHPVTAPQIAALSAPPNYWFVGASESAALAPSMPHSTAPPYEGDMPPVATMKAALQQCKPDKPAE